MSCFTHLLAAWAGAGIGVIALAMLNVNRDRARERALEELVADLYGQLCDDDAAFADLRARFDAAWYECGLGSEDAAPRFDARLSDLGVEVKR